MDINNIRNSSRFLDRATFGVRVSEVEKLTKHGVDEWFDEQFNAPISGHFTQVPLHGLSRLTSSRINAWFTIALWGEDQLRQRMAFALSQIFVVSNKDPVLTSQNLGLAKYNDILAEHAFGKFSDLLKAVSKSPVMGAYLTMVNNRSEESSGHLPDENYAREIMQLFSLGLFKLSQDGEPILGSNGFPIETYTDEDVEALARVFTGWVLDNNSYTSPMTVNEPDHDIDEKQVLGTFIPAGLDARNEMDIVINTLSSHPNTAPFISKLLIGKFVTSNPRPSYIERVANVFTNSNGDLWQVIKAILTDVEALNEDDVNISKIREPILTVSYFYRALEAFPARNDGMFYMAHRPDWLSSFNQTPLSSPSVFNFFSPDHSPNGIMADSNLSAPEFEILDWLNLMTSGNKYYSTLKTYHDGKDIKGSHMYIILSDFLNILETQGKEPLINEMKKRFLFNKISPSLHECLSDIYDKRMESNKLSYTTIAAMLILCIMSPEFRVQR